MANYIFVDFDGPMLPGKMHLFDYNRKAVAAFMRGEDEVPYFDPVAMKMLNLWARHGNAKAVFSTSWARVGTRTWEETEAFLKRVLSENGYLGEYAEDCTTPKKFSSEHMHEISEWCYDNLKPEDRFIAIDDADLSGILDGKWANQGKWIHVNYDNGMSWKNFKDGCMALNVDQSSLMHIEYGIVPKSEEEIAHEQALLSKFKYARI